MFPIFFCYILIPFIVHHQPPEKCYEDQSWGQDAPLPSQVYDNFGSVHLNSPKSTPPASDIFHFYTIHRYIKARRILKISGQNTNGNYIFYVSGDCHFYLSGFLKIPFSDIEFSFKLQKFEKYPSKLPTYTYVYILLSKDSRNHT